MQNINPADAYQLIQEIITNFQGNLQLPDDLGEYSEETPKKEWIPQVIDGLVEVLKEVSSNVLTFTVKNPYHFNYYVAVRQLDDLIKELSEDLIGHDMIRSEDEQYEDPQEWWLRPIVNKIEKIKSEIYWNATSF